MLELIFQGFLQWGYGLTLECWEYFSSSLLDIMSMDFAYLKSHVPVLDNIMQILLAVGWALLIGNLVFQALKSMASGLGFEGEDPKLLFTRTFVFAFLLLASPQICQMGLEITSRIMTALEVPDAVNVTLVDESVFGSLTVSWLLVIIFGVIIMFKVFKLLLEIAERYLILAMLTITAPLAFSMGGSRNTSEIFTGWCRMFGSMCLLMVTNVIFFKMLLSVLSTVPSGVDVLPWMVLILTIVKVARKADAIITRIGLNPAITGDSLGRLFPGALTYMVVRSAASQITKAVGKSAGGSGKGRSPNTPTGGSGGPRMGGPAGGFSGGAGAAGYASTPRQSAPPQNDAPQTSPQQTCSYQSSAAKAESQQTTTQEYSAGSSYQGGPKTGQQAPARAEGRRTSVPPGTRRAPTHIKSAATPPTGTQAAAGRPGAAGRAGSAGIVSGAGVSAASRMKDRATGKERTAASGVSGGVQHGLAGTTPALSSTHLTQIGTQKVQKSPVTGTTQTTEHTGINVGQTLHGASPISDSKLSSGAKAVPSVSAPGEGQQSQPRPAATRFTRRPAQTVPEASGSVQQSLPVAAQTPVHMGNFQHGLAGTSAPASAQQRLKEEPRPGRNITSPGSMAPVEARQHSPVRQEPRPAPVSTMPVVKSTAPDLHPGPAGMASGERQTKQARQTVRGTGSVPAATGIRAEAKAAPGTKASVKGRISPTSAKQPVRKQRGKKK